MGKWSMEYEIKQEDRFFEIHLNAGASKLDVLRAVAELARRDPGKQHPDVWVVAPEFQIPLPHYGEVAGAIAHALPCTPVSNRSAIVAANPFQKAQFEIYQLEAKALAQPLEIRVFLSRKDAVEWACSPN